MRDWRSRPRSIPSRSFLKKRASIEVESRNGVDVAGEGVCRGGLAQLGHAVMLPRPMGNGKPGTRPGTRPGTHALDRVAASLASRHAWALTYRGTTSFEAFRLTGHRTGSRVLTGRPRRLSARASRPAATRRHHVHSHRQGERGGRLPASRPCVTRLRAIEAELAGPPGVRRRAGHSRPPSTPSPCCAWRPGPGTGCSSGRSVRNCTAVRIGESPPPSLPIRWCWWSTSGAGTTGTSNSRQRPEQGRVMGISRSFRPSERLVVAIRWTFSGLAGIAERGPAIPANVSNRVVSSGFRGLFCRLSVWSWRFNGRFRA